MTTPDTITTGDGRTIPPPTEADHEIDCEIMARDYEIVTNQKHAEHSEAAATYIRRCHAAESEVRRQAEEIASLREWKSSILNALKTVPEFETGKWAGDKEGWGFCFEFIHWMRRENASLREQVADDLLIAKGTP